MSKRAPALRNGARANTQSPPRGAGSKGKINKWYAKGVKRKKDGNPKRGAILQERGAILQERNQA